MWLSTVEIGADFAPLQKSSEITVLMYIYEPYPVAGMVLIPAQKLSGMCEHSLKISNKRNENVPFQHSMLQCDTLRTILKRNSKKPKNANYNPFQNYYKIIPQLNLFYCSFFFFKHRPSSSITTTFYHIYIDNHLLSSLTRNQCCRAPTYSEHLRPTSTGSIAGLLCREWMDKCTTADLSSGYDPYTWSSY